MLNNILEFWHQISKSLHLYDDEPKASMSAGEITRLSWARQVRSYGELPSHFLNHFSRMCSDPSAFPYSVISPTYEGFLRREKEKLIYLQNGSITILEKSRHQSLETTYRLEDLNQIEVGQVLLKAWFRLEGVDSTGQLAHTSLRYNTVTQALFQPFIAHLRCPTTPTEPADLEFERSKFKILQNINFKFMNFGRRSILPGEQVKSFIFQPEIRNSRLKIANRSWLSKSLILAHLIILTESELILVRDDPESQRIHESFHYGGIWNYIPLRQVERTSVVLEQNGLVTLKVHLPAESKIERNFSMSRVEEVKEFSTSVSAMCSVRQASSPPSQSNP